MGNIPEFRSQWRSPSSYIVVTIGAVVGLGNMIQFPYLVTEYGGLFILLYVLCELFVSLPLFFAELFIGRTGKQNPVGSIGVLATVSNASRYWRWAGWFSFIFVFFTLSYYCVQAAYPLNYLIDSVKVITHYGLNERVPVPIHGDFMTNFLPLEISFILFLLCTIMVIIKGINRGLETISWIVVPLYFFILVFLALYICITGQFVESLKALFSIKNNHHFLVVLFAAMSYALFKLGVGMGTMIVYGSYLPYSVSYARSTIIIVCFDAIISLLAFFIIYPLMLQSSSFLSNLNNHNVIYIFSTIPNGVLIASLFFFAAVLAAWTCTIAMAETVAVTLIERFDINRQKAALIVLFAALILGSFAVLTHTQWMDKIIFNSIPLYAIVKNITSHYIAPISALLIAIFAGWIVRPDLSSLELGFKPRIYSLWLFSIRYLAPVIIIAVALGGIWAVY